MSTSGIVCFRKRAQNEQSATEMLVELALQELRKSLHLTQEQVAEMMQMNQAAISKMESSLLFKNYANLSI